MRYFIVMYKQEDINTGKIGEGFFTRESKNYPFCKDIISDNMILTNIIELNKKDYNSFCGVK
mgnify:CR=1 FL=1